MRVCARAFTSPDIHIILVQNRNIKDMVGLALTLIYGPFSFSAYRFANNHPSPIRYTNVMSHTVIQRKSAPNEFPLACAFWIQ